MRIMKNVNLVVNRTKYSVITRNIMPIVLGLSLLSSVIIYSCSKSSNNTNNSPAATNKVTIANMAFAPASITVSVGTTVTWNNNDNMTHTVTEDEGSFDSGDISAGSSLSKTFSTAGTFTYHCTIHPEMTGSVVVK